MHAAIYKLLMAVNTEIFFPFFPLLYAYMQNTYFVSEHRDIQVCCFEAGHLLEQAEFSVAPIFTSSQVQKKDSGKQMLP